jgi:hypothetical protein
VIPLFIGTAEKRYFECPVPAGLTDDLNADAAGFVFLLADKHELV